MHKGFGAAAAVPLVIVTPTAHMQIDTVLVTTRRTKQMY